MNYDIIIIGGGIVGCAIAYELSQSMSDTSIAVLERNDSFVGINQSTRNGGVIHSGLYYPQDIEPLKAKLCVEGNAMMYEFCQTYDLPHKKNGKLIIATTPREESFLDFFLQTGKENGVLGIAKISGAEAISMEPNIKNISAALYVPSCGIAALSPILQTLRYQAEQRGVKFLEQTCVKDIKCSTHTSEIITANESYQATYIINAAGLYADEIARMINPERNETIIGTRGELFLFDQSTRKELHLNGHHIYQPPYFYNDQGEKMLDASIEELRELLKQGKIFKTIGVHLTPSYDGPNTVAVGPLKTIGTGKEDYRTHTKTASDYVKSVQYFFPSLREEDLSPKYTGIMAVKKGSSDFLIESDPQYPHCIQLIGMDSPAWTASLAISKYVANILKAS